MKKLFITTALLVALVFSTGGQAATKCTRNQYLVSEKCTKCPANAKCDGKTFTCRTGYEAKNGQCALMCGISLDSDGKTCLDLEKFKTRSCGAGKYNLVKLGRYDLEENTVTYQQFIAKNCLACPTHAKCDGITVECNSGYTLNWERHGVSCKPIKCTKNQYIVSEKCVACPANAKCDGKTFTCKTGYEAKNGQCVRACRFSLDSDGKTCLTIESFETRSCGAKKYNLVTMGRYYWVESILTYQQFVAKNCLTCPAHATCDGKTAKCNSGYTLNWGTHGVSCKPITCTKTQYLVSGKCVMCPANATCDGKTAKCNSGYTQAVNKTTGEVTCKPKACTKSEYLAGTFCQKCPANATCNGKTATCKAGYNKQTRSDLQVLCIKKCTASQYIVNDKCVACPKGATCDGKNPKCPRGYTKDKNGYVICK